MPPPDDKEQKQRNNVVSLGTESLYAIADELRRMYDADLRMKPSKKIEDLIHKIERGDKMP